MSNTAKLISGIAGALVLVGLVLWGVPYYIRAEAQDTFKAEAAAAAAAAAAAGPSQDIQDLTAELATLRLEMNTRLVALETEVRLVGDDAKFVRDRFVDFLDRQSRRSQ